MARPTLEERFWLKVKIVHDWTSCWEWTAAKLPKGYGRFGVDGAVVLAHRMSYALCYGAIPEGMHVDHKCHNTSCVRPIHLRLVTNKQNIENRGGLNQNNTSGVRGVSRRGNKFRATVKHDGRVVLDREYATIEEATEAARFARLELFTHNDLDMQAAQ